MLLCQSRSLILWLLPNSPILSLINTSYGYYNPRVKSCLYTPSYSSILCLWVMLKQAKECQGLSGATTSSKITVNDDCSHEIKRCLLFERKYMTNIGRILKSRCITLMTKVCIFKAMGFPVVMYWHESWTIKKVERLRINAFKLWCWRRLLRVPGTARKIKPVNSKGTQSWTFLGRTDAEAVILWSPGEKSRLIGKNPNAGKDWRQKEKRAAEDEINSFTNSMDMHLSKFQEIVKDREPWCGTVHVVTKSRTWLSN